MFSLIKNSFLFVAELVRQAKEDDRKLQEARIDLKLDKEKSDILHEKQENDLIISKTKRLIKHIYTTYSQEAISKNYPLFDCATQEEVQEYHRLVREFRSYASQHLEYNYYEFLLKVKRCTVQETARYFTCDIHNAKFILERLTMSGYMDKFTEDGQIVYYSRYDFPSDIHPFVIKLDEYYESLVDAYKTKENREQQAKNREFRQQEINDNIFEYAEKHLDKSSYRLFNLICLKGSLTVKEASKILKCDTDKARYILEQLYEKRYIEKRKLEGNRNLYISNWG